MEMLIAFLFGFPGAFLSLLLSSVGIIKEKYWLVIIGAILLLPTCEAQLCIDREGLEALRILGGG